MFSLGAGVILAAAAVYFPPARFDHPYRGELTVLRYPSATVRALCRGSPTGCSRPRGNRCMVIMATEYEHLPWLFRHEQAHCNGWVGHYQ